MSTHFRTSDSIHLPSAHTQEVGILDVVPAMNKYIERGRHEQMYLYGTDLAFGAATRMTDNCAFDESGRGQPDGHRTAETVAAQNQFSSRNGDTLARG